jgi:hypothetical protein
MLSHDGTPVAASIVRHGAELCARGANFNRGDVYAKEICRKKIRKKILTES